MIPETNYAEGRGGERVAGTVCHWTTGTAQSALAHFRDPSSRVSAHYIIDRDGTRIPVLPETDTAYHAGDFATNLETVGIEFVGGSAWGNTFTDSQYAEGARLHRELSARYGFPVDAQHIRPHRAVVATQCPGTLDIDRIIRQAEEEMSDKERYALVTEPLVKETIRVMLAQDQQTRETVAAIADKHDHKTYIASPRI